MIHEPKLSPTILRDVAAMQQYVDEGGTVHCGHDFWGRAEKAEYGDLLLCGACHRYYAKVKHLPWVTLEGRTPRTNHLPRIEGDTQSWYAPVEVRVTR